MTHWRNNRNDDDNDSRDVDRGNVRGGGPVDLDAYRVSRGGCSPHDERLRRVWGDSEAEAYFHLRDAEPATDFPFTASELLSAAAFVVVLVTLLFVVLHR